MRESNPMNTNEEQAQSIHHYFDPQEVQLTMRQTSLIQARELTGAMVVYGSTQIKESDMTRIAKITIDIAQIFESYLASGDTLK